MSEQTILVVDDEQLVLKVITKTLEHSGFLVLTATNGVEALQILKTEKDNISLVMLDLTMPIMGGLEVYTEIQRLFPSLPVIFCSGYGFALENQSLENSVNNRMVRYLQKPFSLEELIGVIQSTLSEKSSEN